MDKDNKSDLAKKINFGCFHISSYIYYNLIFSWVNK